MRIPNLKERRERAVLSQRDLAKRAGLTQATIVAAEQGKPVRISTARKLARALGVPPAELWGIPVPPATTPTDERRALSLAKVLADVERARERGDDELVTRLEQIAAGIAASD